MQHPSGNPDYNRLRKSDLIKLLDCAVELQQHDDPLTLPVKLVQIIEKLVPSEIAGYNEVDVPRKRGICYLSDGQSPPLMEALERNIHQHPIIQYARTVQDEKARTISDFCDRPEFHKLALYNELYRVLGVDDQIAISVWNGPHSLIGLVANRDGWGFSNRERAMLTLLNPHVRSAHRNARKVRALQEEADRLHRTLDQLPLGLAARDASGDWVWITEVAERMVRQYFPIWRPQPRSMPDAVNRWAAAQHSRLQRTLSPAQTLTVCRSNGQINLQFLTLSGGLNVIVMREYSLTKAADDLSTAGLTPREASVVYWVVEGKTNPQIGSLLGISARTVQKHLERVFQKWQVESRTSAALRARQLLNA